MESNGGWLIHRNANVNGITLHYVEAGEGPLVILLHGFPDFWYAWRHQIPALAAAGFHVVAPDMRGYNASDKPRGVASYAVERLVEDVAELIRHVGGDRAVLVGHDWGGIVGWYAAMLRPDLVERLVVLNAPHPVAFRRELRRVDQMLRSSYALFFQLPWLPEQVLRLGNYAVLRRMLRTEPVHQDAFTPEDIECYVEAVSHPGALTASINYYRAATRFPPPKPRPIDVPTLLIWGEQDLYLNRRLTEGLEPWISDLRIQRLADASHWVMADAPQRVNRGLLDFLRED